MQFRYELQNGNQDNVDFVMPNKYIEIEGCPDQGRKHKSSTAAVAHGSQRSRMRNSTAVSQHRFAIY
jgi:hypothetical protein